MGFLVGFIGKSEGCIFVFRFRYAKVEDMIGYIIKYSLKGIVLFVYIVVFFWFRVNVKRKLIYL